MGCIKIGNRKHLCIILTIITLGHLSASEGRTELQTVKANGITVIKAYKVPTGESKHEYDSKPEENPNDIIAPRLLVPPGPKCNLPETDGEIPFPGAMVTLNKLFVPVRGQAKWLAPDPGDTGKMTIEGIDADGDCVRDDIEYYIAQKYPNRDQHKARKYLFEYAKYLGLFLRPDLTREYAVFYSDRMYTATACARKELGDTPTTVKELDMIFAKFHNTMDRSYRYIHNNGLLGGTNSEIPDEIICDPLEDPIYR